MRALDLKELSSFEIKNCYDSHAHFRGTGEFFGWADFSKAQNLKDLQEFSAQLVNQKQEIVRARGLSTELWQKETPTILAWMNNVVSDRPFVITKEDAHGSLLNEKALQILKKKSEHFGLSAILVDEDHFASLALWPSMTEAEHEQVLLVAQEQFLKSGITHVRDMTTEISDLKILEKIYDSSQLKIAIECNFILSKENISDQLQQIKSLKERFKSHPQIRVLGMKVFYDGTLGNQTALISENYRNKDSQGNRYLTISELKNCFKQTWSHGLELSVHAIGDLACEEVVQVARQVLSEGTTGFLNIEHAEILKPETIQKMKSMHVRVHMQPCQWLSDRSFLQTSISPRLRAHVFPIQRLINAQVPLFMGCDSPVTFPSVISNIQGAQLLKSDHYSIEIKDIIHCHSHPDPKFFPKISIFEKAENQEWQIKTIKSS